VAVSVVAASSAVVPAEANAPAPGAGAGVSHSIRVQLENLPKRYSCADLTTITTQILQAVGIRSALRVFPQRCERALGSHARSPAMTVTFREPVAQPGIAGDGMRLRIGAGTPVALKDDDCELLRQLYFRLLSRLELDVPAYSLACMLPRHARPAFHVTVQVPKTSGVPTSQQTAGVSRAD
jgi:hypothetical protein